MEPGAWIGCQFPVAEGHSKPQDPSPGLMVGRVQSSIQGPFSFFIPLQDK